MRNPFKRAQGRGGKASGEGVSSVGYAEGRGGGEKTISNLMRRRVETNRGACGGWGCFRVVSDDMEQNLIFLLPRNEFYVMRSSGRNTIYVFRFYGGCRRARGRNVAAKMNLRRVWKPKIETYFLFWRSLFSISKVHAGFSKIEFFCCWKSSFPVDEYDVALKGWTGEWRGHTAKRGARPFPRLLEDAPPPTRIRICAVVSLRETYPKLEVNISNLSFIRKGYYCGI